MERGAVGCKPRGGEVVGYQPIQLVGERRAVQRDQTTIGIVFVSVLGGLLHPSHCWWLTRLSCSSFILREIASLTGGDTTTKQREGGRGARATVHCKEGDASHRTKLTVKGE